MANCKCGAPLDADWKTECKVCYAKRKKAETEGTSVKAEDKMMNEESLVAEIADLQRTCFEKVGNMLGHIPVSDGELAMVNTLFIATSRKIYGFK